MRVRSTLVATGLLLSMICVGRWAWAQSETRKGAKSGAGETEISLAELRPLLPKSIQEKPKWAEQFCFSKFPRACAAVAIRDPRLPGPTSEQVCRGSANDPRAADRKLANDAALKKAEERVKPGRAIVVCTP